MTIACGGRRGRGRLLSGPGLRGGGGRRGRRPGVAARRRRGGAEGPAPLRRRGGRSPTRMCAGVPPESPRSARRHGGPRGAGRDSLRRGADSAHHARPEDGCPLLPGDRRRVQGGSERRRGHDALPAHADHRGGHRSSRESNDPGGGRGGAAGGRGGGRSRRPGGWARWSRPSTSGPP